MVVGKEEKMGNASYSRDPLYPFAKAFTEAANQILCTEQFDLFQEPSRTLNNRSAVHSLKEFFVNDFVDENANYLSAEEIEELREDAEAQFDNDLKALRENAYMSEYAPMVGMSLPIHKLILMNNVFSQGGGIQRCVAARPSFTISMERRILVAPDGTEIDMFLEQNKIADVIDSAAPMTEFEVSLPENETTDFLGNLGGTVDDELSVQTSIIGIYAENVYIGEGKTLPVDGWFKNKGPVATAETAGTYNGYFPVNIAFTPTYGGPGRLERAISAPITIKYIKNAAGDVEVITDKLFGSMNQNKITLTTVKGAVTKVKLATKLSMSNAMHDEPSVKWKVDTTYVEIPEAMPINTTITPDEVKDVSAMYEANQVTKIMSITKTALSEYKDKKMKNFFDNSFDHLDERNSCQGEFDFAPPEGYALDWVTYRQATFMDYFDDMVTKMLQSLNDNNMTISVFGDPRIVRKITPTDYVYQAPANIGPVTLDYTQTIVNTKDQRVYNFIGSDKFRGTNELMIILNPRNTERIIYRLYDYQMYISNEIRNAKNPALPAIHAFDRWLMVEYQPVQSRIQILNPSGTRKPLTF